VGSEALGRAAPEGCVLIECTFRAVVGGVNRSCRELCKFADGG